MSVQEQASCVVGYVDRQIEAIRTAGRMISRIEMTVGAQEMLRLCYFPESNKPKPDGGIFRYRGYPVETATLDTPAVVYAK